MCFEMNPDTWRAVNGYGLQLLLLHELKCYCDKFPNKEDLQDEWKMAVTHPGKYVNLLVGQLNNKDLRAERDKENHYDSEPWDWVTKNFFLACHQVKAQACWFALRPDEVEQEVPGKDLCLIFVCTNGLQFNHLVFAALV